MVFLLPLLLDQRTVMFQLLWLLHYDLILLNMAMVLDTSNTLQNHVGNYVCVYIRARTVRTMKKHNDAAKGPGGCRRYSPVTKALETPDQSLKAPQASPQGPNDQIFLQELHPCMASPQLLHAHSRLASGGLSVERRTLTYA